MRPIWGVVDRKARVARIRGQVQIQSCTFTYIVTTRATSGRCSEPDRGQRDGPRALVQALSPCIPDLPSSRIGAARTNASPALQQNLAAQAHVRSMASIVA